MDKTQSKKLNTGDNLNGKLSLLSFLIGEKVSINLPKSVISKKPPRPIGRVHLSANSAQKVSKDKDVRLKYKGFKRQGNGLSHVDNLC